MQELFQGVIDFGVHWWQYLLMYAIGGTLIYLAIKKDYEPMLLLPIGLGAILVNLPLSAVWTMEGGYNYAQADGVLGIFFNAGIMTEIFPVLIFVAVGAMIDFTPLLRDPKMIFFGAAAQFGIFFTIIAAMLLKFPLKEAASIGIIGAADGPTSIFVASRFAQDLLGPITVAAYSYMSLVPVIMPPVIKALTTKKERMIRMENKGKPIPRMVLILFPIMITVISGIIAPISVPLIGLLMFGNLIRECLVLDKLSKAAQNELSSLVTLLLGITIGASMHFSKFLTLQTVGIMCLGLVAFIFDVAGGVLFAKLFNVFSKNKVNPMIGAAGISAFPMASRIVQKLAKEEDPYNFILMPAVSANVAGQLGSVVAGGMVLALVPWLLSLLSL
ncbi:MAG: sodium ion-translocating decarboxylase subunit beta [Clostridiales bacterium]|jgi:oxaloacetate decarboxylase beta subunit|nr:sodium ion-translocating decarboxylase subunit beta [Clostridiales bacterium]